MAKPSLITFETEHVGAGITAGFLAGIVFGSILAMSGDALFPAFTRILGIETVLGNFLFHAATSVLLGIGFSVIFGHAAMEDEPAAVLGMVYSLILWVLGPLVIVPLALGEGAFLSMAKIEHALPLLWGHVIYGFTLGQIYPAVVRHMKKMMRNK